ncbi:MAG: hypothetical protein U9Q67_00860 [Patescibacteria group bacterium]|nr:hypothetical protein [Patescibacteria group bacterium]
MEKLSPSQLEKLMKKTYSIKVGPKVNFESRLHDDLILKHQPMNKSFFDKFKFWTNPTPPYNAIAIGTLFTALVIVGIVALDPLSAYLSKDTPKDVFGMLSVVEGEAIVRHGQETSTVNENENKELQKGDSVETTENTIADVNMDYGRVSLSSSTTATLEDKNGNISLENGEVYARSTQDTSIVITTDNGEIEVQNGSTIAIENEEEGTTLKSISGTVKGSSSKDGTRSTKEVENGKQVTLKAGEISDPTEIDRDTLKTPFCEHNWEQDDNPGTAKDLTPPEISIIAPENRAVVQETEITVQASSNEDGWAKYNGVWNEITANESFSYTVTLERGENKLQVLVKDKSYNRTTKEIIVTYETPASISLDGISAISSGIYLKWSAAGIYPDGRYIVRRVLNGSSTDVLIISSSDAVYEWVDTSTVYGITYQYYVILLGSDGLEAARTPTKSATAVNNPPQVTPEPEPEPENGTCSVSLTVTDSWLSFLTLPKKGSTISSINTIDPSGGNASITWTVTGDCGEYSGFKVVWNITGTPVYPGDHAKYLGKTHSSYTITGLPTNKTVYIRVGLFNQGVTHYSNEETVLISD